VSRGLRRPTLGTGAITPTEVVPWVPVTPVEVGPDLVGGNTAQRGEKRLNRFV
jgi:hypothetical protein